MGMANKRPSRRCAETLDIQPCEMIAADVLVFIKVMEELLSAMAKLGLKLLSYLQKNIRQEWAFAKFATLRLLYTFSLDPQALLFLGFGPSQSFDAKVT